MTQMNPDSLSDVDVKHVERHGNTDHFAAELHGEARLHVTVSEDNQICATLHDGNQQAAIVVDDDGELSHVYRDASVDDEARESTGVSALGTHRG
jgi:hypothetical protein